MEIRHVLYLSSQSTLWIYLTQKNGNSHPGPE